MLHAEWIIIVHAATSLQARKKWGDGERRLSGVDGGAACGDVVVCGGCCWFQVAVLPLSLYRHQHLFFSVVLFFFSSLISVFFLFFLLCFFFFLLPFSVFFLCLSLFSTILFLLPKSSPLSIHLKMFPPHYLSFVPLKTHRLFLQIFLPPCSACWAGYL